MAHVFSRHQFFIILAFESLNTSPPPPTELPKPAGKIMQSPADMGRGGTQHQAIQQRLKGIAEELGFRAIIEKQVLDGEGSVDLALEKGGYNLACEITVTTTTDHEFGNIQKCIKAGFTQVAVISPKAERLRQIEEAVTAGMEPEQSARIGYFTPDQFITSLRELVATIPVPPIPSSVPTEKTTRG